MLSFRNARRHIGDLVCPSAAGRSCLLQVEAMQVRLLSFLELAHGDAGFDGQTLLVVHRCGEYPKPFPCMPSFICFS